MFYKVKVKDHVRVPPSFFGMDVSEAITKRLRKKYEGFISKEIGMVIDISSIDEIRDGTIIPGDGASYYETVFNLLVFRPDLQEVIMGKIKDVAEFGAFITLGPIEGMIHISQSMDDFVSFSKDKVLLGKDSKHSLKPGDLCRARIIAISYKDISSPKLGLTMRQDGLGKIEWLTEGVKG